MSQLSVQASLLQTKHKILNVVRAHPPLFLPLRRLVKRYRHDPYYRALERDTELVIEGFFRTANTFAKFAFLEAQVRDVKIVVHTHAPATVIQAVRWGVPVLLLIREPVDTVASLLLKHPFMRVGQAYRDYVRFYTQTFAFSEGVVIGLFEQVVSDYGVLIGRLNKRFRTDFALFEHTPVNEASIRERIRRMDAEAEKGDVLKYSVPSPQKSERLQRVVEEIITPKYGGLRMQAEAIYEQFVTLASEQRTFS